MKIIKATEATVMENPHGVAARKIYDSEHAIAVHLTLEPGQKLKKHITPVDVFFYVLQGTGIVEVGDEKIEVSKDSLIESPAKIPHCWYNEGSNILKILVVKVPKPVASTKIL